MLIEIADKNGALLDLISAIDQDLGLIWSPAMQSRMGWEANET